MTSLRGWVASGYGVAAKNLAQVQSLIEARSGLGPLLSGTLNIQLAEPYPVVPDFIVTGSEYFSGEEIRFQHCMLGAIPCLIMRPDSHERGYGHGPAHLELMSTVQLRAALSLQDGDQVEVLIARRAV